MINTIEATATITMPLSELRKFFSTLPKLYTAEDIALEYHMNERYVRDETNAGRLKGVKIANCWHFTAADVAAWIEIKKANQ